MFQDRQLSKCTLSMCIAWHSILSRLTMNPSQINSLFKEDQRSILKQSIQQFSICTGTKRLFAPTNPKITIGTIVCMLINHSIIDAARTSITTCLKSAKTMIRIRAQDATISVSFHTPLLSASIIHASIRQIHANNIQSRRKVVRKVSSALLYTKKLSKESLRDAISCFYTKD